MCLKIVNKEHFQNSLYNSFARRDLRMRKQARDWSESPKRVDMWVAGLVTKSPVALRLAWPCPKKLQNAIKPLVDDLIDFYQMMIIMRCIKEGQVNRINPNL